MGRAYIGDRAYFPPEAYNDAAPASASSTRQPLGLFSRLTASLPSLPPLLLPTLSGTKLKGDDNTVADPKDNSFVVTKTSAQTRGEEADASARVPNPRVKSLVTLGTPQRPVPSDKGQDRTGGALSWVHTTFPG